MKTVAFYTLGCKLNYSETSTLARQFEERGFRKVDFEHGADIYIINTCSVTDNADKKARKVVREALKLSPQAFVGIIGCYAQLKPQEISEIPGVDAVLGAAEKFRLLDLLPSFEKKSQPVVFHSEIQQAQDFFTSYSLADRTRTFLKVQDGCDYSCSFCTIPLARGKSRSDSVENIVAEAHKIGQSGVKEIVLTGVNIGDYGLQKGERKARFLDLVQALDEVESISRFRISSIEPNLLSDDVIRFVAGSQRFVPHFHVPLQSGSNTVLGLMRRRYRRELYADRVAHIKSVMPQACIGVDVIVGFPGETDALFKETYNFLNELDISYLHVFTYSERANTHAISLPGRVDPGVRHERSKMLHILSDKKRRAFYAQHLGQEFPVLFEADIENGQMSGFTPNYIRVAAKYDPLLVGEFKTVKLASFLVNGDILAEEPELVYESHS